MLLRLLLHLQCRNRTLVQSSSESNRQPELMNFSSQCWCVLLTNRLESTLKAQLLRHDRLGDCGCRSISYAVWTLFWSRLESKPWTLPLMQHLITVQVVSSNVLTCVQRWQRAPKTGLPDHADTILLSSWKLRGLTGNELRSV